MHDGKRWILVNSHRRSGTHFLIDALLANIPGAVFPASRHLPVDFNIGSVLRRDPVVLDVFLRELDRPSPVIIKSHLLPEEMSEAGADSYTALVAEVFARSYKFYVHRNAFDTLASLYRYSRRQMPFNAFVRTPNDHVPPVRRPSKIDANRARYWNHHVTTWLGRDDTRAVAFEDLKRDPDETLRQLLASIGCAGTQHDCSARRPPEPTRASYSPVSP